MKQVQLTGIGNGVVDAIVQVSREELRQLDFQLGSSLMVDKQTQEGLLRRFSDRPIALSSGGSVANSIVTFAMCAGGRSGFISSIANDSYGRHFVEELKGLGVQYPCRLWEDGMTATAVVMVTPDGERTMRFCLGDAAKLNPEMIDAGLIENSEWLFVEGYLLANGELAHRAVQKAVQIARSAGCKIAFSFSEAWVVQNNLPIISELLEVTDLVFMNRTECAGLGRGGVEDVIQTFADRKSGAVITLSEDGALYTFDGEIGRSKALRCEPLDATGAGDVFSAMVLEGLIKGRPVDVTMKRAAAAATAVITQIGGRLSPQRLAESLCEVA